ncbi:lactose-specific PTS transporter subunit EIIC [Latilactobacillus curvatus]|uniref:lactose-specific PTS transporter subunit EIIC n=1 Tax=Latilactobacillus curvatus TaxID=28038 RepID=UPI0020C7E91E|nr:lactose-specific PTS transporter subunit EIIC [Latilactobacillus curvatus]MCP8862225.1 lactose-specific PTS transporter subunit EIIC [Latilactobacillus curvatus]MCP8869054.1 lactose-specific PTS transporter subunit EIIC [Latilactobacillus curvatus]MCP8872582.1 lactose-specific PTS transporter subunit EIIC [Latilactobacillus curvatus]MCP8881622.1 lactose-specific PTS transporter subunit EIIC [Latilactobacillus curvatus]MDT7017569.1 lactose-specific PTS transporter subunit EIIC [Latilactobaci
MDKFQKRIEKLRPVFEKIAANAYISAIRDGFIAAMPIILFSSVFLMIAYVPNAWGFFWPKGVENNLMLAYNYSMGLLALFVAGTTAKNLTDTKNIQLPKTNQINPISVIMAAMISFFILAALPLKTGSDMTYMGTQGLIAAYLVGLIIPNIYYVCIKNNITIKLPPQVPGNISQTFKDVIPMAASVTTFWAVTIGFKTFTGTNLPKFIIQVLSPLFKASDSYLGLALIAGAMAFFWFCGVQGPSIVSPAVTPIMIANTAANLQLYQAGQHASHVLAYNTMDFVMNFGGTGSTFVLAYLMLLFARSKELKATGKAAFIPGTFSVNEPVLFGTPIIMNPIFFLPFILTPILNIWMYKFFVTTLGMNSIMYTMPWTLPGPIGLPVATGFAPLSFVLVALMLVVDIALYLPFLKVYDLQLVAEEAETAAQEAAASVAGNGTQVVQAATDAIGEPAAALAGGSDVTIDESKTNGLSKPTNVLVLCAGGGTSGILANALNKLAEERKIPLQATARAYGQDMDLIEDMDLVILAPQMDSQKGNLKKITDKYGVTMVTTTGREYIQLTQDGDKALKFVEANAK